jgi:DNA-binding IclR family transcriptional regulator
MLEVLLRCGFVEKTPARDAFRLTPKLFVMGQQFPPVQRLLDAALPRMRALSALVGQSCHLAVGTHRRFLVLVHCTIENGYSFDCIDW